MLQKALSPFFILAVFDVPLVITTLTGVIIYVFLHLGGPITQYQQTQTLKLIIKNSGTVGGPLTSGGPPSRDAAATPSLRHWAYIRAAVLGQIGQQINNVSYVGQGSK